MNNAPLTKTSTYQRTWDMIVATNGLIFIYMITQKPRGRSLMINGNCYMHEFLMLTQYEVIDMLISNAILMKIHIFMGWQLTLLEFKHPYWMYNRHKTQISIWNSLEFIEAIIISPNLHMDYKTFNIHINKIKKINWSFFFSKIINGS
jgi:hypothetical protein